MITKEKTEDIAQLIKEQMESLAFPTQPRSLYDPVRYMLSSEGKHVRFYLTLLGCGLCGGNIRDALPAATAIELLHNFTLLHDDIMDAASTRRGKQSVFKKWDSSIAILSGDSMYAWAFEQLQYYGREIKYSKAQYHAIMDTFLQSAKTVCEGQAHDLDFEDEQTVTLKEYEQMINRKTAALIRGAFKMGGEVSGASASSIERLGTIGTHVGIGFQIQDDLLDVVADPEKFGKKTGGDILKGKKTYLSILALQRSCGEHHELLKQTFGDPNASKINILKVIDIYKKLGVVDMAHEAITEHYNEAIRLAQLFDNSSYRIDLIKFLTSLKCRKY